jgi:uncharacterized damage-inducible protein DinB
MSFSTHLIEQLDAETDASRRVIERIPDSILEWRPHAKSWNTLELATHIANLVSWGAMIATTESLDFESDEAKKWTPPTADTIADVLALLDANASALKSLLSGTSDADLETVWEMRSGEQVFSSDSRLFALSRWVLAHQSHHRGELMVYLRMNDVPLPGIFGPTADEQEM